MLVGCGLQSLHLHRHCRYQRFAVVAVEPAAPAVGNNEALPAVAVADRPLKWQMFDSQPPWVDKNCSRRLRRRGGEADAAAGKEAPAPGLDDEGSSSCAIYSRFRRQRNFFSISHWHVAVGARVFVPVGAGRLPACEKKEAKSKN